MSTHRLILGGFLLIWGVSWLFNISLFNFILPLLIIWLGLHLLIGQPSSFSSLSVPKSAESVTGTIKRVFIFSGINKKFSGKDLHAAKFVCLYGGGEIDLSAIETKSKQVSLDVVAIFGSLKIILPAAWSVTSQGTAVLGAFNNQTQPSPRAKVEASVRGAALFGAVEILSA